MYICNHFQSVDVALSGLTVQWMEESSSTFSWPIISRTETQVMHTRWPIAIFMFWITGMRRAPPDVKETYCISCKCSSTCYCVTGSHPGGMFQCSFLLNRSDEKQWSVQIKAVGCWSGSGLCVGALRGLLFLFLACLCSHDSLEKKSATDLAFVSKDLWLKEKMGAGVKTKGTFLRFRAAALTYAFMVSNMEWSWGQR